MTFLVVTKYKKKQGTGSVFNHSASRHHSTDRYLIFYFISIFKRKEVVFTWGGRVWRGAGPPWWYDGAQTRGAQTESSSPEFSKSFNENAQLGTKSTRLAHLKGLARSEGREFMPPQGILFLKDLRPFTLVTLTWSKQTWQVDPWMIGCACKKKTSCT